MNAPNPVQPRPKKRDVHGWLILDKPVGMTSTHAVAIVKRVFRAKKAGHAGTLDPLASGCLPIALGEATKTVPYVMDGEKAYRFTVNWGTETTTDDTEGTPTKTSDKRPGRAEVEALLPRFTGAIQQVPPQFSAIKIDGERAYDLARDGETVKLEAREVVIDRLEIVSHTNEATVIEAECGKEPMCARSPAISAARSGVLAMSRPCVARVSGRFPRRFSSLSRSLRARLSILLSVNPIFWLSLRRWSAGWTICHR